MSEYRLKSTTQAALDSAFGFRVDYVGSKTFDAHGEKRCIYTVKRPNGSKHLHAVMYANGSVSVC